MNNTGMSMLERSFCLLQMRLNYATNTHSVIFCILIDLQLCRTGPFVAKKLKSFSNDESISRSMIIMNSSNHQLVTVQLYRRILLELHVQI